MIINNKKGKKFYLMNRKGMFFRGLLGGDVLWTNNIKEAKPFYQPSKLNVISRWKPEEKIEIVYD